MAKRYNLQRIKTLSTYSAQEIADLIGVHVRTVHVWYTKGLPKIDERRPFLVRGCELKEFLQKMAADRKKPCRPDEMYCVSCRAPRKPANRVVETQAINKKKVLIIGKCDICGTKMNRFASARNISQIVKLFEKHKEHKVNLSVSKNSIVNTDKQGDLFQ